MKKLLLIIAAIFTLNSVSAELFFLESFEKPTGNLCTETFNASTSNSTDWYIYLTGGTTNAQIVEGTLSYTGYPTKEGKKLQFLNTDKRIGRQFSPVKNGKVYYSVILNIDSLFVGEKDGVSTNKWFGAPLMAFSNTALSGTPQFAGLYVRSVKEGDAYIGYQLAVSKNKETGTSTTPALVFSETLKTKTNYLVVVEYEFVEDTKNDIVRLYINPTKETTTTTLTSLQEVMTTGTSPRNVGAGSKDDAAQLNLVYVNRAAASTTGYTPVRVFVDEIKVATTWAELFGEGGDIPVEEPAEINVSTKTLSFASGMPYTGETYTATFTVTGKNLKGDITLTSDNAELTLDKTTIAKADAETEAGVTVTATLTPVKVDRQKANITLTTDGATATITSSWWTTDVKECNTVAELKTQAATASGWDYAYMRFTGEAVVTYKYAKENGETVLYLEDNTAAISITDTYWNDAVKQGDKVTGFGAYAYANAAVGGVLPITPLNATITVLNSNNEVTPQTITLAELQKNPLDYLLELVKVIDVTLDQTSTKFGQKTQDEQASIIPDYITQNGTQAKIQLQDDNELIGATKPKKADITGISTNTQGNSICVRGASDIISKDAPTAIDNVAMDELLSGEYEVYTVSGQRIDALQPGVNIIRKGNTTYKVVR